MSKAKSNVIEYRGYTSFVRYSAEDDCLYGKVEGIRSTILFDDGDKPIRDAFAEAVDDYLAWCAEEGSEPEVPYKGLFNVRIDPELHRRIAAKAQNEGISLNRAVAEAIAAYA